ncbi:MAG: STAS domain-containing protein [Armatimonadetes bacterium]|nr:STAS domain-containing protein [Armatimonadota bacterium]
MQLESDVLQLHTDSQGDIVHVRAVGDIDLSTTPQLREVVEEIVSGLPQGSKLRFLLLDIREIAFIDSAGLALLVEIRKRFHDTCRLAIHIAASTQPERVLRLGRFDTFLIIGYSPEELAAAGIPVVTASA